MSVSVTFNGQTYSIPQYNDTGWAQGSGNLTLYLTALGAGFSGYTGDITLTGAGLGLVVTTPDGLHTYRIAIDNAGEITTQQLT
jgi:hypothetical protein